jgi:hypothetical protein
VIWRLALDGDPVACRIVALALRARAAALGLWPS